MRNEQRRHMATPWMAVLLVAAWLSLGMGGLGDADVITKIPKPERSFLVELVDADDVSFALRDFSMNGLTMLPVAAGKADISLDFAEIMEVRMYLQDDRVLARVLFRDQTTREFIIEPDLAFYGLTDWGKLKIKAEYIRRVTFLGRADQPLPVGTRAD
ncbi:hypothetical protein [Desulfonatronum sp. SC1]|uniref:hypothetical protein n=1 Tax=Desulfonatronum sp. SC1 TaxID=2109626 RepID=UPI000D2FDED4|nr:hypothetical protein [Desulfonatronum sp. SC1]PTN38689.1 hypothetical protein C6366_01765 [Desulfonatronum sp. SC1]